MPSYNDPHRERAFQFVLPDIKASQKKRDGRYQDMTAQLDSLADKIEEHDLLIKLHGKPVCTPTAKQLRDAITAAFGGVKIFTAPMQILTVKQKQQYLQSPSTDSQTPRKLTPTTRGICKQANHESSPTQATQDRRSRDRATEQSASYAEALTAGAGSTRPNEVERRTPMKLRLHVGNMTKPATASPTADHDASRGIANSQNDNAPLNERDSGGKNRAAEVIDLSDGEAGPSLTTSSLQDGKPKLSNQGKKRKAETTLEGEEDRKIKKRAQIDGEQRSIGGAELDNLVSGTKQSADNAFNVEERGLAKERTFSGEQAASATDLEIGLLGRGRKRKEEAIREDNEQLPNKRVNHADREPSSITASLTTRKNEGLFGSATTGATTSNGKPDTGDRYGQESASRLARQIVAQGTAQQVLSDETMRRARLGLGPNYPFDLRGVEDLEMQVATMVSTIRKVVLLIDASANLKDAPPSLMTDPDRNTGRLYERMFSDGDKSWSQNADRFLGEQENTIETLLCGLMGAALFDRVWSQPLPWQTAQDFLSEWRDALSIAHRLQRCTNNEWPLEYFIYQISADRLENDSDFDKERIQPLAREYAESLFTSLIPQLRHMYTKLSIPDSMRDKVLVSLTRLFADALKLRGRLEAAPADYEYLWLHSGSEFDKSQTEELRGYDENEGIVKRTMACLLPAIRMRDPDDAACEESIKIRAQVFGS